VKRQEHWVSAPVHVTMRALSSLVSFRGERIFKSLARSLRKGSRDGFRIIHWTVQRDHVHLIAEADSNEALRSGAQGIAIRLARTFNRVFGRKGRVWRGRHGRRDLRTPRQVRNALVYVLFNHRKHSRGTPHAHWAMTSLDPKSSALWFDGFRPRAGPALAKLARETELSVDDPLVVRAETALARRLWRRSGGLIHHTEAPSGARS
jgi:putative transposase